MKAWTGLAAVIAPAVLAMVMAGTMAGSVEAQTRTKAKAKAPQPAVAAPVTPPVDPGPPPEPLGKAVQNYAAYQNDITLLQGSNLANANDLEAALDRAAGVNRAALTRGWIAYGAMTAAQSPEFVAGVRSTASHYGRDVMIRGLTLDPAYAQRLKGGADAARLAMISARADGARVYAVGERYKEMAYSLQSQRWANQIAPQQPARVTRMRTLANGAATRAVAPEFAPRLVAAAGSFSPWTDPNQFGGGSFWDTFRTAPTPPAAAPLPAPTPAPTATLTSAPLQPHHDRVDTINRMTTLAALYVMDATLDPAAQADRLLSEGSTERCLELAQVQFYQCMSAARFRYENAFCLGEHALKEMGACIRNSTVEAQMTPVVAALPPPAAPVAPEPAPTRRKKR
jgi:hypothetical protein